MTVSSTVDGDVRVLMVVTSDAYAGLERHVVQLSRELRYLGCDASIACPPSARRMRSEAARHAIPVVPTHSVRRRAWLAPVAHWVRERPPQLIHIHDGRSALAAAVLVPLSRGRLVRTQHFFEPASATRTGARRTLSLSAQRTINRLLTGFVAVSPSVADAARARREIKNEARISIIPPGVELASETAAENARAERAGASAPTVAYIGRLEPEKQLNVLICAIPFVLRAIPDCRFVLAGAGSDEPSLKRLAAALGVEHAISWPGWVQSSADLLHSVHLYVNPWPNEGFGMAMAEAMSYAIPVIGVASGASADLIQPGQTGYLAEAGDALSMAAAIVEALSDPGHCETLGRAAREDAVRRYGVQRAAELTFALYRSLIQDAA